MLFSSDEDEHLEVRMRVRMAEDAREVVAPAGPFKHAIGAMVTGDTTMPRRQLHMPAGSWPDSRAWASVSCTQGNRP